MSTEIPKISFRTKSPNIQGIEIFTLQDLIERKDDLDHNCEKPHQVGFYMLIYYTNGSSKHLVDFVWHEVEANTAIYLTKGQVNAFRLKKGLKGFMILFTEKYFYEQLNRMPQDSVIRLFTPDMFSPKINVPESSTVQNYVELMAHEFYASENTFNKKAIINNLYRIICSKLETIKQLQTNHLKDSKKLIAFLKFKTLLVTNLKESRNAKFYAIKLNITYKHLNTISKEISNMTAKQFIDSVVILEAKRQLVNSSIKSTELAFSMGFEESGNFIKYFKKHTGLTPNEFKDKYK